MSEIRTPAGTRLSGDGLDRMLRDFFQGEMPDPWPILKAPETVRLNRPRMPRWSGMVGRLALAAAIGFLLIGYLTLASNFPRSNSPQSRGDVAAPDIGQKNQLTPRRVPTRSGGEAIIWEKNIPGDRPTIVIEVQEIRKPKGR